MTLRSEVYYHEVHNTEVWCTKVTVYIFANASLWPICSKPVVSRIFSLFEYDAPFERVGNSLHNDTKIILISQS